MTRTTIRSEDITAGQVKSADLASDAVDTTGLETDIALLGFKVAANGSLAAYNLKDQTVDAFEDASGVDASASTDEVRNASNYYSGASPASGGTITTDGDYTIHTFTSDGTFVAGATANADILLVAGGGGGSSSGGFEGGGGGGGYLEGTKSVSAASYPIVIGAGGVTRTTSRSGVGGNTTGFSATALGGGGGGNEVLSGKDGEGGGSGGGGGGYVSTTGGSGNQGDSGGLTGYGNNGGTGNERNTPHAENGGGGGGAGASGGNAGWSQGGNGGNGKASSISGSSVTYAGGGGGNSRYGTDGSAGTGGGGDGTRSASGDGVDGLGGGGGAAREGGSGIAIIRFTTGAFDTYNNVTLVSNSTTADSTPTTGDIVMTYTNGAGTATVNTDLKAWISRDNGTTYTQATLSSQGTTGGHTILTAHNVDISSQPSGTSMRYKITTHNQSVSKETRIQAVSLGWA